MWWWKWTIYAIDGLTECSVTIERDNGRKERRKADGGGGELGVLKRGTEEGVNECNGPQGALNRGTKEWNKTWRWRGLKERRG
jgi:hypothetical protein